MSKEIEDILRFAALILVFLLIIGIALGRIRKLEKQIYELEHAPADTVTVVKHDTIKIDSPVPVYKYIKDKEYIAVHDTTLITETDTVTHIIQLPREYLVYKDSTYRAVVSGVQPRLDSMEVYQKTVTNTVTKYIPKKAALFAPFVEGGVSVNARDNKEMMWEAGAGILVRGKVGAGVNWQHNMHTKQDYIGGKIIINLK